MPVPPPTPADETELRPASHGSSPESSSDGHGSTYDALPPHDPDAPLSFVPHTPLEFTVRPEPLRVRTGRYGVLEEHELVTLIDSIEDERARARFRESVYLSIFVWIAIALFAFFGPRYLWHAPRVVLPSEVLRARELTMLTDPTLHPPARPHSPPPSVDNRTLEHMRSSEPRIAPAPRPVSPPPTPRPEATQPTPRPETATPQPRFQPPTATPNLPSAPTPQPQPAPRTPPPPVVADAPRPQPSSRPNFNQVPQSASDSIQDAIRNATRGGGGNTGGISTRSSGSDLGMGMPEILSDTQGVNFNPYLQRLLREIKEHWIPLIPEEARPPLSKQGTTMIRFSILPDGSIGAMHLEDSTHDDALNRAAWGSITGVGQFEPLPSQFHGPNLELRIHYLVNEKME